MAMDSPKITMFRNKADDADDLVAGSVLFRKGELGKDAFVVVAGELEVRLGTEVVAIIREGEIVGEMAMIDTEMRSADCVARTDVKVIRIDQKKFTYLIQQTPFFAIQVMKIMALRLRRTNARVYHEEK